MEGTKPGEFQSVFNTDGRETAEVGVKSVARLQVDLECAEEWEGGLEGQPGTVLDFPRLSLLTKIWDAHDRWSDLQLEPGSMAVRGEGSMEASSLSLVSSSGPDRRTVFVLCEQLEIRECAFSILSSAQYRA